MDSMNKSIISQNQSTTIIILSHKEATFMLNGLFILIGIAAIIMLLVEAICSVYIGIYGLFTLSKNCIRYVFSAKFRQTFKESNDKQFMLKPHD